VARIFWVTCPACRGRFSCHAELRHSRYKLSCPYCDREFEPQESPRIDD